MGLPQVLRHTVSDSQTHAFCHHNFIMLRGMGHLSIVLRSEDIQYISWSVVGDIASKIQIFAVFFPELVLLFIFNELGNISF